MDKSTRAVRQWAAEGNARARKTHALGDGGRRLCGSVGEGRDRIVAWDDATCATCRRAVESRRKVDARIAWLLDNYEREQRAREGR